MKRMTGSEALRIISLTCVLMGGLSTPLLSTAKQIQPAKPSRPAGGGGGGGKQPGGNPVQTFSCPGSDTFGDCARRHGIDPGNTSPRTRWNYTCANSTRIEATTNTDTTVTITINGAPPANSFCAGLATNFTVPDFACTSLNLCSNGAIANSTYTGNDYQVTGKK